MISLVVVSHSSALANAAVHLASEMVPEAHRPAVAVAAGLADGALGTDAAAVAAAIESVHSPDGVLVLTDLGSALLSADLAMEFLPRNVAERVLLSAAPLVEGLVVALVTAATGASLELVEAEARNALAGKLEQLGVEAPDGLPAEDASGSGAALTASWRVPNPHGLHARPAAALVSVLAQFDAQTTLRNVTTGAGPVSGASVTRVATLGLARGHEMELAAHGPDAQRALDAVGALVESHFGELDTPPAMTEDSSPRRSGREVVLGPAWVSGLEPDVSAYHRGPDEVGRFRQAVSQVRDQLRATSSPVAEVFAAQEALASDPELLAAAEGLVGDGFDAPEAARRAFAEVAARFDALGDPYLRARGEDVRSLSRLVRAALVGERAEANPTEPSVLVVPELDAVTAASLDPVLWLGVVTVAGGTTGHGVLVASSRGIPVLAARPDAAAVRTGDLVGFDPVSGELVVRPDEETQARLRSQAASRMHQDEAAAHRAHEPAVTRSGRRVLVEGNVSSLDDAKRAGTSGADGIGLVRTELLFGERDAAPGVEEQAAVFRSLAAAVPGQIVTIRTWDVGGDKPLHYLSAPAEPNPFLGERGLRLMRRWPEVFDDQLAAVLMAGRDAPLRLMFPMVTSRDELIWARERLDQVASRHGLGLVPVGIMVEVPAAALQARQFVGLVDFVSFGTNDLGQYAYAVDRGNAQVSPLLANDAVLSLMRVAAAQLPGVTLAVCGDLASDPQMVGTLLELGVSELSVRPPLIPTVKQAVRAVT